MNKCYFRSFDVGIGDCCVIRLVKECGEQYVIMVDCGKFTPAVKRYVEGELQSHINLLVATHIDGDHINGCAQMLKKCPNLQIDHIWYNCYGREKKEDETVELKEEQKEILQWVKNALPAEFDAINYKKEISAEQGKTLAGEILKKEPWRNAWNIEYITDQTPNFDLGGGFGKIVLLGPPRDALDEIEKRFKDAFNKYFMQVWNDSIRGGESLSELLIRLADAYKDKFEKKQISAKSPQKLDAEYVKKMAEKEGTDTSDTNYSSIAFMLECGVHKVAMLGDSFAVTLENAIKNKYGEEHKPLDCDAIKVAHHGSNGNTSKSLLEQINSNRYFIPGGRKDEYPTWGTIGRIALSHQEDGKSLIVFSHKGDMSKLINGLDDAEKETLHIETIITEQEYELFEW
ncbi:MAG: hypothetical protein IJV42_03025 [Bacteroidaceae bacterium]|nr:hypothetical protein [Bacteroidaceae bacterium]